MGDYFNRNKVASYATGKYIKYLDSDDKIAVDGLQIMLAAMEAYPQAGLGIAQFDTPENYKQFYPECITPAQAYLEHFDGQGILRYGPTGTIIRREVFYELNCFGTSRFLGDTEFWLKLASKFPIVKIQLKFDVGENRATFDLGNLGNRDNIASKFETQSHWCDAIP